jgi:hypothetical protein
MLALQNGVEEKWKLLCSVRVNLVFLWKYHAKSRKSGEKWPCISLIDTFSKTNFRWNCRKLSALSNCTWHISVTHWYILNYTSRNQNYRPIICDFNVYLIENTLKMIANYNGIYNYGRIFI